MLVRGSVFLALMVIFGNAQAISTNDSIHGLLTSVNEWKRFPWNQPETSKLLNLGEYENKEDGEGNSLSTLKGYAAGIGPISIDVYKNQKSDQSRYKEIVFDLVPDGVSQSVCDAHLAFLSRNFGKPYATRDVSIPGMMHEFSVQWVLGNTTAEWMCVGVMTPKQYSLVKFKDSTKAKRFADLIPLDCTVSTQYPSGEIKSSRFQIKIDPYANVIRRVDNSIFASPSNVQITDQMIRFKSLDENANVNREINRMTGVYKGEIDILKTNAMATESGECRKFDPSVRKF